MLNLIDIKYRYMKKYEYKYVKTEAIMMTASNAKSFNANEAILTGYGLKGWRVNAMIHSVSLLGAYYLLEREVLSQESEDQK